MKNIDIDLRLLELFCCVYEKGSISESSNCLHLSQSTVSFHIHQLERSIGLKLFYKKGRRLLPTSNAHILYPYAKRLLELKLSVVEEIKLLTGAYKGYIKLGASSIPGKYILPEFICRYLMKNPNTQIDLLVDDSYRVLQMVELGEVDLGFVGFLHMDPRIHVSEIWEDRIFFVGNKEIKDELSLEELLKLPFILREENSGTRKFMEEFLKSHGVDVKSLNILLKVNSNSVILDILKNVRAVSYLSSNLLKDAKAYHVKLLRVKGIEPPTRKFYLVYHKSRPQSPAVRNFLEDFSKFTQDLKV
ncbi:MAG: LysR family transcriptional regulator [Aquificaceae bacterium]|nr:LysR family transcriptional regulator [Aquificaceae bacterium]MDW8423408.1 LysR family transcriptional regulator [Aquificaceae bacterium]